MCKQNHVVDACFVPACFCEVCALWRPDRGRHGPSECVLTPVWFILEMSPPYLLPVNCREYLGGFRFGYFEQCFEESLCRLFLVDIHVSCGCVEERMTRLQGRVFIFSRFSQTVSHWS